MSTVLALLLVLAAGASGAPEAPHSPSAHAQMARAYMRLLDAANAFALEDAIEAREALLMRHGRSLDRIGASSTLRALMALGEPFPTRRFDWWQGRMPERNARYLVVWWHPNRPDSRRVVLGAQAIGAQHGLPVIAMVPDGRAFDRKDAAGIIAICPDVTFAATSRQILDAVDLTDLPLVTVVEDEEVLWHGKWEGLRDTPLSP